MREAWLIASRELSAYLRSPLGYIIAAAMLFVDGALFNLWAMSDRHELLSAEVLRRFFYVSGGTVMFASVFLSMRLFAEERASGTIVLLNTAPVREWQVVLGKWLSAFLMLTLLVLLSFYLPLLVMVNGKISFGQVLSGYVGLLALGACTTAMSVFGSAMVRSQILAAVLSGAIVFSFVITWLLPAVTQAPISDVFGYLAIFDKHFYPTFSRGIVSFKSLFFFAALSFLFLTGTSKVLAARRWVG